jgi:hypothetical protein
MYQARRYYLRDCAHQMLTLAIAHGDLIPSKYCYDCGRVAGDRQLHGHHEDYGRPLEVVWLCSSCHRKRHYRNSEEKLEKAPTRFRRRNNPKMREVIEWLKNNPDQLETSSRQLVEQLGVSHMTINKAQMWAKANSTNGHR